MVRQEVSVRMAGAVADVRKYIMYADMKKQAIIKRECSSAKLANQPRNVVSAARWQLVWYICRARREWWCRTTPTAKAWRAYSPSMSRILAAIVCLS